MVRRGPDGHREVPGFLHHRERRSEPPEDGSQPFLGPARVQSGVGGAALEDGEHDGHVLGCAAHQYGHPVALADAQGAQFGGVVVARRVQFPVREPGVALYDGDGAGVRAGLVDDGLVDELAVDVGAGSGVTRHCGFPL